MVERDLGENKISTALLAAETKSSVMLSGSMTFSTKLLQRASTKTIKKNRNKKSIYRKIKLNQIQYMLNQGELFDWFANQ